MSTALAINTDPTHWLESHGDYLCGYAMIRLRKQELAEELVQETFLAALRARKNFSGKSSIRTWLVGILKHKIIDHYRAKKRERPVSEYQSDDESTNLFDQSGNWKRKPRDWDTNPEDSLEQREFWATLNQSIDQLPPRMADVFRMRELEKISTDEICAKLKITPTNLGVLLFRARNRIRETLGTEWFGIQKN